ncbi:hypothetical protein Clacol_004640 [Clathrus columnatus]|uniref:Uncharacterized protein n=1 Tax=Clathrus columnatus TaxID=1419009 RepID=A0AAV5AB14_9AGAM|nr:hypothetical protein Clacol_004640 [Clathrus columnatus]
MIHITVDSFKYTDSFAVYELPEGSSVIDLKTEIEATESILIGSQTCMLLVYSHTEISGHQRLVYDNRDLQDNEKLDSSIFEDPSNGIIYLLQARIYLHLIEQDAHFDKTSNCDSKPQEVQIIEISVDLERPVRKRHDWVSLQSGWLYGTPIGRSKINSSFWQPFLERQSEGYFPEVFVSYAYVGGNVRNNLETEDNNMINIPPQLPPFRYPPADGMTFHMPISDNGHSFLKLTVDYALTSHPVDPTHVTISLLCTTHDIRRISSISVFITIPQSTVSDVQICENEAHRKEIQTDQEVTETRSQDKHFDGINIGVHGTSVSFQGGISQQHSIGNTVKASKVFRRKVDTGILKEDTIFWNLKAPMTRLDDDGLNGEEFLTFVLTKKPVRFKYKCRVTHAVGNGVKKTTERISRDWSFLKLI